MKEIVNPEIEALIVRADALKNEAVKLYIEAKEKKQKLLHLDYKEKYIKYIDEFDSTPIYMKVNWIKVNPDFLDRFDFSYTFTGIGFWGEFTGYDDATSFDWSYWFEFNIYGNEKEFLEKVNKIEVIDKAEFDEAFNLMIDTMKEYQSKIK